MKTTKAERERWRRNCKAASGKRDECFALTEPGLLRLLDDADRAEELEAGLLGIDKCSSDTAILDTDA